MGCAASKKGVAGLVERWTKQQNNTIQESPDERKLRYEAKRIRIMYKLFKPLGIIHFLIVLNIAFNVPRSLGISNRVFIPDKIVLRTKLPPPIEINGCWVPDTRLALFGKNIEIRVPNINNKFSWITSDIGDLLLLGPLRLGINPLQSMSQFGIQNIQQQYTSEGTIYIGHSNHRFTPLELLTMKNEIVSPQTGSNWILVGGT